MVLIVEHGKKAEEMLAYLTELGAARRPVDGEPQPDAPKTVAELLDPYNDHPEATRAWIAGDQAGATPDGMNLLEGPEGSIG